MKKEEKRKDNLKPKQLQEHNINSSRNFGLDRIKIFLHKMFKLPNCFQFCVIIKMLTLGGY